MRNNRAFTLLELCVVILILSTAAGFLGWRVKEAIDHHQFKENIHAFTGELRKLQSLALSYRTEVEVKIFSKKEKLYYEILCDEPLPFLKIKEKKCLKQGRFLSLDGRPMTQVTLILFSSGRIEPAARLLIETKNKEGAMLVDLRTPLQIKIQENYSEEP